MMKKSFLWILVFSVILCGCRKEDREEAYLTIRPDWGKNEKPLRLTVLLYDGNGNGSEYSLPATGDRIEVPRGEYRILLFNDDVKNVTFRDLSSFENACAVMSGTKATALSPDPLFSYGGTVTASENGMQLTPSMKPLTVKAAFEIHLEHAAGVAEVESNIRNVPDAVTLGGGVPFYTVPEAENALKMESVAGAGGTYVFYCSTFGSIAKQPGDEANPAPRILVDIGITYENGESKVITADVTEAIEQATGAAGSGTGSEVVVTLAEMGLQAIVTQWVIKSGNGEIDDDK